MQEIQELIFAHGGVLSGSFVRDVIIRGEDFLPSKVSRDVDVLITFSSALELLDEIRIKYPSCEIIPLSFSEEDKILHYHIQLTEVLLDVFAGSDEEHTYLCSPDADVNCLCYDGQGFFLWYPVLEENYGLGMDEHHIIERILKKEAVLLVHEWEEEEKEDIMKDRISKLANKGWTFIGPKP
nr:hypothetical protein Clen_543 [Cedratvirus lena]